MSPRRVPPSLGLVTGVFTPEALVPTTALSTGVLAPGVVAPTKRLSGRSSGSTLRRRGGGFLEGVPSGDGSFEVRWAERWVDRLTSGALVGVP